MGRFIVNAAAGDPLTLVDFESMFQRIVGLALGFAGIVLFILLIIGGFRFITSGGDPKSVEGARKILTSAILGLIIILASYLILVLINVFTGVNVLDFKITL